MALGTPDRRSITHRWAVRSRGRGLGAGCRCPPSQHTSAQSLDLSPPHSPPLIRFPTRSLARNATLCNAPTPVTIGFRVSRLVFSSSSSLIHLPSRSTAYRSIIGALVLLASPPLTVQSFHSLPSSRLSWIFPPRTDSFFFLSPSLSSRVVLSRSQLGPYFVYLFLPSVLVWFADMDLASSSHTHQSLSRSIVLSDILLALL